MSIDPREVGPKPPFPKQEQTHPGTVKKLNPPADHGEESYVGTGKLKGRAAIVTGADSGIGRAVAIAFAKEGADVLLSYLPEEEPDAAEVVGVIEEAGRKAVKLPGDIRKPEYCQALVAAALKEFGRLDVVVNNAGFQMTHDKLEDVPLDEVKRTFDTNIFGTFRSNSGSPERAEARCLYFEHNFNPGISAGRESGRLRCDESGRT